MVNIAKICQFVHPFYPNQSSWFTLAFPNMNFNNLFPIWLLALALVSCARQGAPAGGPKDTTPPSVDTLYSTRNYSTRFRPSRIELRFDEWVTLSDAASQIVVSPPLAKRPEVVLRGKTVTLTFDPSEQLRDSATYTINFGTAVKDLHEGNPAKDLRFVFSTGDMIDSLRVSGRVADALTGDPVENISVMLYDIVADSVVRKSRPYYFSRTDKSGKFEIRNVKSGRFKVAAIDDVDQNLRWDGENEKTAFLDTLLSVRDSALNIVVLRLFKNQPRYRLAEKNADTYGVVRLKFSGTADSALIRTDTVPGLNLIQERTADSVLVWYDLPTENAWYLLINSDTVKVKALSKENFIKRHDIYFDGDASRPDQKQVQAAAFVKTIQHTPGKPLPLLFNVPVVATDTSLWVLTSDSTRIRSYSPDTDSTHPRRILLDVNWQPAVSYKLELLPGAITDLWGGKNSDTLRRQINIPGEKQLSSLTINVDRLIPGEQYVLQLVNGPNTEEERVFTASAPKETFLFPRLPVAPWISRVFHDSNRNGRWDTGDYYLRRQPEANYTKKIEGLRANWELSVDFTLDSGEKEQKKSQ